MMRFKPAVLAAAVLGSALSFSAHAADYVIDTKGAHAFVQFRIQHLGYSWLYGRFNEFEGTFSYDAKNPEATQVNVEVNTTSVDTNHAERDKHIRSDDFFNVDKFPSASFESTAFTPSADGGTLAGNLTFHGVTKPIEIAVEKIGEGTDPWGGYRAGFEGRANISLTEFGIKNVLGPKSEDVELMLSVEGIRQ